VPTDPPLPVQQGRAELVLLYLLLFEIVVRWVAGIFKRSAPVIRNVRLKDEVIVGRQVIVKRMAFGGVARRRGQLLNIWKPCRVVYWHGRNYNRR